jgi:aspartate/methionine/tyrosine aminotransferase
MFSYAGERVGLILSSSALMERHYAGLEETFGTSHVRRAINKSVFNLTAGAPHSAQYGIAALLTAVTDGEYDLSRELSAYGRRAEAVKEVFAENGFHLIYESDVSGPVQHGFYFTFGYPGFNGVELLRELLHYGLTALPLEIFGSCRADGLRACVALVRDEDMPKLAARAARFRSDH